jgi:hypothetical protein
LFRKNAVFRMRNKSNSAGVPIPADNATAAAPAKPTAAVATISGDLDSTVSTLEAEWLRAVVENSKSDSARA